MIGRNPFSLLSRNDPSTMSTLLPKGCVSANTVFWAKDEHHVKVDSKISTVMLDIKKKKRLALSHTYKLILYSYMTVHFLRSLNCL